MNIRDRIALGTIAGIFGTIPQLIFNYFSVQLGYSKYYSFQLSSGTYLLKGFTDTTSGFVFGAIVWMFSAAFIGILIVYLLTFTGTDYWWLKGILVNNVIMFTFIYGFLFDMGAAEIVPLDIPTNYTTLIGNTLTGFSSAYLTVRWGSKLKREASK